MDRTRPITTKRIVDGGVTTPYDQKIVRLMSRSNASPDAACVICASVSAGGDAISSTFDTTNTGLQGRPAQSANARAAEKREEGDHTHSSKTRCRSNLVETTMSGSSTMGVMTILDRIATTTVRVSPGRASSPVPRLPASASA